ncbi:hypothetical protein ACFY12_35490 [Streptomyces sp. NPDC001339]|uniref:hypothetical protein n=1 Tax=Streptomyces sp. NPDC001339 TaxID=3364563 RepID=UPI00367A624D
MTTERFFMLRVEDLLLMFVETTNLRRDGALLVREDPDADALLTFTVPAQHISETVVPPPEVSGFPETVPTFVSGDSTLVFRLPDGENSVELSVTALLDWNFLESLSVPAGFPDDPAVPNVFGGVPRTLIEFPTRVMLGHMGQVVWRVPTEPVVLGGRCELFNVALRGPFDSDVLLRAVATPRDRPPRTDLPLTEDNLIDLVALTSDDSLVGVNGGPVRQPLRAERFVLTPLGASVRMAGEWEPAGLGLQAYHHSAELGRDQFVQVVERGYLSTGHRALLVRTSERKFSTAGDGTSTAYLQQETRITVSEPEVFYGPGAGYRDHEGREMAFASLRITDTMTPPVVESFDGPFWVTRQDTGLPYRFGFLGTDRAGRTVTFTMPLVFVRARDAGNGSLADMYRDPAFQDRRTAGLNGQLAALAEPPDDAPGATTLPVGSVVLTMAEAPGRPLRMLPAMQTAQVRVPAAEQLTGLITERQVTLHDAYLAAGTDGQATGAFLNLLDEVPVSFAGGKGGGIARPDTVVQAVTSRAGLLPRDFAGLQAAAQGLSVDKLQEIFGTAKLLGVIDLFTLLAPVEPADLRELVRLDDDEILRRLSGQSSKLLPVPIMRARELAAGREVRYLWKPRLTPGSVSLDEAGIATIEVSGASLRMEATTTVSAKAVEQSAVRGEFTGFALSFADIVTVRIGRLAFTTRPGSRPDLTAAGLKVEFANALQFVNALKNLLPADGFGKGAFTEVRPTGITAGYSLAVPAVPFGVFSLTNVTLTAALTVPLDERPASFRFSVSERHQPFNLSVALFGGGGFFSMIVSTRGVELVEGSLEFGGNASLDLGVASGGIHLMAGIYFALTANSVTLTGYLRCGGYLSVLGLVTVSVEFRLQLTYVADEANGTSEVFGEGTVTVSVKVAFFSKSVSLGLQRRFGGSALEPGSRGLREAPLGTGFGDLVGPADWDRYCLSFHSDA